MFLPPLHTRYPSIEGKRALKSKTPVPRIRRNKSIKRPDLPLSSNFSAYGRKIMKNYPEKVLNKKLLSMFNKPSESAESPINKKIRSTLEDCLCINEVKYSEKLQKKHSFASLCNISKANKLRRKIGVKNRVSRSQPLRKYRNE